MRKKPAPAKHPAKPGAAFPGQPMQKVPPARKPAPRAVAAFPGQPMQRPAPAPRPAAAFPGQPMQRPAPARKPAAKKKRQLAAPGENCVLDACWAIAGCRPDLDCEDGLFIPEALEVLGILGLITGFAPADLDSDLSRPGLVLGVDLPGPHALLTTPDGWWSWGEPCDPADFPAAVIEEAWQVTR